MLSKYKISTHFLKKILCVLFLAVLVSTQAQYIDTVFSFLPAPGQYTNTSYGNNESAKTLVGGLTGGMSLGAFGGYVVFAFENSVENHPDNPFGVDFTIFGNAAGNWSEPGIVYVMKDDNENGLPDDIWYELAGSDHFFSSTIQNYEVVYTNPNGAVDVPWSDNLQTSGVIDANEFHTQAYYPSAEFFPTVNQDSFSLNGTRITPSLDDSMPGFIRSYERTFGYADNHPKGNAPYDIPDNPYSEELENGGGDAFDISWAIDENGNYVDLTEIDFIKIQNACMHQSGTLGYLSAEILGAIDVSPGEASDFSEEIVVIKDIPLEINSEPFQLEACAFQNGRLIEDATISWESNQSEATINSEGQVSNHITGSLELRATYTGTQTVSATVSTTVVNVSGLLAEEADKIKIYPNPASDKLYIESENTGSYKIYNTKGVAFHSGIKTDKSMQLDVSELAKGIYILSLEEDGRWSHHKILIVK